MTESAVSLGVTKWLLSNSVTSSKFILNLKKRKIGLHQLKETRASWPCYGLNICAPPPSNHLSLQTNKQNL